MGETLLEEEYRFSNIQFIVAPEGLLLYKKTDHEDELTYDLFPSKNYETSLVFATGRA
jgi:hypothetical protein